MAASSMMSASCRMSARVMGMATERVSWEDWEGVAERHIFASRVQREERDSLRPQTELMKAAEAVVVRGVRSGVVRVWLLCSETIFTGSMVKGSAQ